MRTLDIVRAWGCILAGRTPSMSIEITRQCPLSCPGCYAYRADRLGAAGSLADQREFQGTQLVDGVLSLVDRHRPLHLSIVGGEPLIRRQEITRLLPELDKRGIHTQVVTSAVGPIPLEWRQIRRLTLAVSIDGLQPEHDRRRSPATYDRILRNNTRACRHRALHCDMPDDPPGGVSAGVRQFLGETTGSAENLDKPVYASDRGIKPRNPATRCA